MATSSSSSSAPAGAAPAVVKSLGALGFPFKTQDPFLFCVYHRDLYPAGNASNMFAPRRGDGADFDWSAPYRMYHGDRLPGFPQHPHRGFETLTLVQEGRCDHTDSLGAAGRYGGDGRAGDLQWMTAGRGCVHGENFPLINVERHNHLKLFQIWLNLPAKSKMAPPGYKMSWAENMVFLAGENGAECEVAAGRLGAAAASTPPPPYSWAAEPHNDVGVFYVTLPPRGGRFVLPPAAEGAAVSRSAFVVEGATVGASGVSIGGRALPAGGRAAAELRAELPCELLNEHASEAAHVLVLQGRPIGERTYHIDYLLPVTQYSPDPLLSVFHQNPRPAAAAHNKHSRGPAWSVCDEYAGRDPTSLRRLPAHAQVLEEQSRPTPDRPDPNSPHDNFATRAEFGGWPWSEDAVAFPRAQGRFADMVDEKGVKVRELPPGAQGGGGGGSTSTSTSGSGVGADGATVDTAALLTAEDVAVMSVKQLKAELTARGVPLAGLAEKADLVAALQAAAAAR